MDQKRKQKFKNKNKSTKDISNFYVLHLAVSSVSRSVHDVSTRIVECVYLDVQRKPLDALLGAEVRGEALHSQVHLSWRFQRVPVDRTEKTEFYNGVTDLCVQEKVRKELTARYEKAPRCDQPNLLMIHIIIMCETSL